MKKTTNHGDISDYNVYYGKILTFYYDLPSLIRVTGATVHYELQLYSILQRKKKKLLNISYIRFIV